MKRPGEYGRRDGGAPKRQFGSSGPSYGKSRQDNFGDRDMTSRQARDDRGGFNRGDRADRNGGRPHFDRNERGSYGGRPERQNFDRPRSFDRSESRSFGPNNGQSYRREGGQSGGYGRPNRPVQGGFDNFVPGGQAAPQGPSPTASTPVPAHKLQEGVAQANKALATLVEQFGNTISGEYDISQLEATVSFDRNGRFLGFGNGGAVSFSLTITPLEAEDVFAQDEDLEEDAELGDDEAAVAAHGVQAMSHDDDLELDDDVELDADDNDEADALSDDDMDASSAKASDLFEADERVHQGK